ncbi:MAG: bifunctional folylpolyglutamate synthase/dihydrofolate synthase [Synergistaceae bacterium]|nr:bifunctional folylpolyglutamate synthase/dihydrofolate synthase [Synergistaceae bacterium]
MISFDGFEELMAKRASPGIRPGLDRIGRLLSLLDNPQGKYPAVHVVGTNGKGSTCAFLASVFRAAGYRTALYTSPHLENPGERLLIDGHPLPPERWMACAERITQTMGQDAALREDPPSYFELVTATAFLLAEEEKTDVAVVEAGLGGRLDATNLLSNVACTAIASISMDHTEYLGDTLEKIAGEKFAVVRRGAPACYLGDVKALVPQFRRFCSAVGAKPFIVSEDARVDAVNVAEEGCAFDFSASGITLNQVRTKLIGRYQVVNAALALSALSCLTERFDGLTESAIRLGMLRARWPGRLEIVSRDPLVVLDGGHNLDGVTKLAESVAELWGNKRIGVVYGVMKDKDYPECLDVLNGLHCAFYATCVPGMERSLSPEGVAAAAGRGLWRNAVVGFENPLDAIAAASRENEVVVVCGSLYLVGWVRSRLVRNQEAY